MSTLDDLQQEHVCEGHICGWDDVMRAAAAEIERLTAENERLRRFVDFVNVWCYRESKVSASERLEAIQYHPVARTAYQQLTQEKE